MSPADYWLRYLRSWRSHKKEGTVFDHDMTIEEIDKMIDYFEECKIQSAEYKKMKMFEEIEEGRELFLNKHGLTGRVSEEDK